MAKLFANSEDPDQTLHSVASDLDLHCLPITLLRVSRLQWVNPWSTKQNYSRWHSIFFFSGKISLDISYESSAWQMADDSHEMSRLICFDKYWKKNISKCPVLQLWLAFYGLPHLHEIFFMVLYKNENGKIWLLQPLR